MTLTPVAERLAVELSLPVLTTYVCRDRGSNPDLSLIKIKDFAQSSGETWRSIEPCHVYLENFL